MLAPMGKGGNVNHIAVAVFNTNVIYASSLLHLSTTNGGTSWNTITGTYQLALQITGTVDI